MVEARNADAPSKDAGTLSGELKTSAHLMMLEPGVYCVFRTAPGQSVDPATGLPDIRVSRAPEGADAGLVEVVGFRPDGWVRDGAALVRVTGRAAPVLITVYQRPGAAEPAPKIQIQLLTGGAPASGSTAAASQASAAGKAATGAVRAEISAHVQRRGDITARAGEWVGDPGSQRWVEGFSFAPEGVPAAELEYQAVLGRGWLSPWSDAGQYCGSRGMALPILGLRVRLKGETASRHAVRVSATFTDGTRVGPLGGDETCEAETLAPLEAFRIELVPHGAAEPAMDEGPAPTPAAAGRKAAAKGGAKGAASKPAPAPSAPSRPAPARPAPGRSAAAGPVPAGPAASGRGARAVPPSPAPTKPAGGARGTAARRR